MSDPIAHRSGVRWGPAQFVLFGDAGAVSWPAAGFTADGTAWETSVDPCGADGLTFPTPTATPYGSNHSPSTGAAVRPSLDGIVQMLPTPRTSDTNGAGLHGNGGLDLRTAVSMLPTPVAADYRSRTSPGDMARKSPALEAIVSALPERFGKYASAVRRHELAYGMAAPDPTEPGRNGKPRLSAEFPAWMQGLPPGYLTDVVDRKAALRLAGNGVNWRQAAFALSTLPTFRVAVAEMCPTEAVAA